MKVQDYSNPQNNCTHWKLENQMNNIYVIALPTTPVNDASRNEWKAHVTIIFCTKLNPRQRLSTTHILRVLRKLNKAAKYSNLNSSVAVGDYCSHSLRCNYTVAEFHAYCYAYDAPKEETYASEVHVRSGHWERCRGRGQDHYDI